MRARRPALFGVLLALAMIAPGASAGADPAAAPEPAGEPAVAEQQPRDILERVEVRPDGAVLFDGEVVTGDEAERLKLERDDALRLRFVESWDPDFLYYDHWAIFVPDLPRTVMELPTGGPLITGVATTPAAEVIVVALTEESASALRPVRPGGPDEPKLVHATGPADDHWYHEPMTLSPSKRWLLAMVSEGRRSAIAAYRAGSPDALRRDRGDIVLLDCGAPEAPVVLIAQARVHSCTWSPDGGKALCHVELPGRDEPSFVLLDMGSHSATVVAEGRGRAEWIGLGAALRVYLASGEVVTYEPSSGRQERQAGAAPRASGEWVWSDDGSVAACPVHHERPGAIRIASPSGRVRTSPALAGVERVLGWSAAGQLLAYVGRDSALHFCSGAVSDAAYEQLLSYVPPAASGTQDELRESVAPQTRSSPVRVPPDQPVFWGWGRAPRGPFLAYVLADDSQQTVEVLQFERLSVWDLGMDPERPLPEQMAEQYLVSHIGAIAHALRRYAADHDGRLPPAAAGPQLEADLAPYLDYPGQLHKLDSPGEVGIRLHWPGSTLTDIAEAARRAAGQRVWILEYVGDYPTGGGLVAVCSERRTSPGQCRQSWHTVLERPGEGGEAAFEDVVAVWSETFGGAEIGGLREDQSGSAP